MKRVVTFLIAVLCALNLMAEKPQVAIFVYSDSNVPTTALRSQLTTSFLDGGNSTYGVVDRTDEFLNLLNREYQYQGSGMVRDDQLASIGEQLGANYICVVAITYYADYNQYFFDGKLIDVNTRQVIKNVLYPQEGGPSVNSMDHQTQMRVGKQLAIQFDLYSSTQLEAEQRRKIREEKNRAVY